MKSLLASASASQGTFLGEWEFHLCCNLVDCPGKIHRKVTNDANLGLKTEYARLGGQSGYQRMEVEEVKGGEKVGKQLGLFCAQFSPLSPWWTSLKSTHPKQHGQLSFHSPET